MIEDTTKVQAYLAVLNNGPTGPWIAADGFFVWAKFAFGVNGQNNEITADEGIVVKAFVHSQTGEIKTILAQAMVRDA